ncbi:MAG TPA: hypothetical protein VIT62_05545 [Lysobacter sp.]
MRTVRTALADQFEQIEAIGDLAAGHVEVGQDQVERPLFQPLHQFVGGSGFGHGTELAAALEQLAHAAANNGMVVGDDDAKRHGMSVSLAAP